MHQFINFIIESGISLSFFGMLYYVFLRRETFFLQNRIFLFVTILFSVALPLLHIRVYEPKIVQLPEIVVTPEFSYLQALTAYSQGASKELEQTISSSEVVLWVYAVGALLLLGRLLAKFVQIYALKRKGTVHKVDDVSVVITDDSIAPFAFLNMIFIPQNLKEKDGYRQILLHEMEHVKQRHSYDILSVELLTILQWCNPFVWLLKRAVHENHEYLADKAVLAAGTERGQYKLLLLNECLGEAIFIASPFNYSLIKNRIKMMNKMKSHKIANLKYVLGIFIAAGLVIGFALENKLSATKTEVQLPKMQDDNVTVKIEDGLLVFTGKNEKELKDILKFITSINTKNRNIASLHSSKTTGISKLVLSPNNAKVDEKTVFVRVEQMPEYPGGMQALLKFVRENIKYPKEAVDKGIEGNVYLKFVIEKTGEIGDVKTLRTPHELLTKEAIRVVKMLPKFQPGMQRGKAVRVWYQLPVRFAIPKQKAATEKAQE